MAQQRGIATMHIITIEKGEAGKFNVLLNGHSYRIHRNLSEDRAVEVAEDARRQFCAIGQRSVIKRVYKAKEVADAAKRLASQHQFNIKSMRKVAETLRLVIANPDNIIQGPDMADLDWCINVLNNPEV